MTRFGSALGTAGLVALMLVACGVADIRSSDRNAPELGTSKSALESPLDDCDAPDPTESLVNYATACSRAMGAADNGSFPKIPNFDCDDGVEVPDTHPNLSAAGTCDRPNVLNSVCDPGSKFQVLVDRGIPKSAGGRIRIVAHCRKKHGKPGEFSDIAVIANNSLTGDTCFFQNTLRPMSGKMPSPNDGEQGVWLTPNATQAIGCIGCHDTGAFIRDPYLSQLTTTPHQELGIPGPELAEVVDAQTAANNKVPQAHLPGARDYGANRNQPYRFVGKAFQGWRATSVSLVDNNGNKNPCFTCHRLGMAGLFDPSTKKIDFGGERGTARLFGVKSVARSQTSKNDHSNISPIWMTPLAVRYQDMLPTDPGYPDDPDEINAQKVQNCARLIGAGNNQNPNCNTVEYARGSSCTSAIRGTINGSTASIPGYKSQETVVDVPIGTDYAFLAWQTIHGPFVGHSINTKFGDADLDASYLRIGTTPENAYRIESGWHGPDSPVPRAAPGGDYVGVYFADIANVNQNRCYRDTAYVGDLSGTKPEQGAGIFQRLGVAWSFIGNVSRDPGDFYGVREQDGSRRLQRSGKPTTYEGEAFSGGCYTFLGQSWVPKITTATSTDDALVATAADAKQYRLACFISGITGDWGATEKDATVQPYAQLYAAGNGDVRLRVSPSSGPTAVTATASCLRLRP